MAAVTLTGKLEQRDRWRADDCPLAATLEIVGTRSAFLILREAFYGGTRFDEIARRAGISEPVTAARLRELVEHGLLVREPYREPGQRTRDEYRLTERGTALFPTLVALMQWGNRWLNDDGGPVELRHHGCGAVVAAELRCTSGHAVEVGDLDLVSTRR